MSDLLFDVSWWIPTCVAVVGIALFFNGNRRQLKRLQHIGLALVGLAIVWELLTIFVDTGKKYVQRETRAMVADAVQRDWTKFKADLVPTTVFRLEETVTTTGADNVTQLFSVGCDRIKLTSAAVRNLVVEQTATLITARFDVFSMEDEYAPVENSNWQFDWEQTQSGWKVREIRMVAVRDIPNGDLGRNLPGGVFK